MESPVAPPLHTTIGIEIELLLVRSTAKDRAEALENEHKLYGIRLVHEALSEPMLVRCFDCGDEFEFGLPLNRTERGQDESDSGGSDADEHNFSAWSVKTEELELTDADKAILQEEGGSFKAFGVEVISRILHTDKPLPPTPSSDDDENDNEEHTHTIHYKEEVNVVFSALHNAFNTTTGSAADRIHARLFVNKECSLHVHVGNENKGFPLPTVKNALGVYVACEQVIDSMHDTTRISGSDIALHAPNDKVRDYAGRREIGEPSYNWAISDQLMAKAYVSRRIVREGITSDEFKDYPHTHLDNPDIRKAALSFDAAGFVDLIQLAPDLMSLKRLLHGKRVTVNPYHLDDYGTQIPTAHMTLEFRQHGPTLNTTVALAWIDFVQRLVNFSHETSKADFMKVCEKEFLQPHHSLTDLLTTLEVNAETSAFYLSRAAKSPTTSTLSAVSDANAFNSTEIDKTLSKLVIKSIERLSQVNDPENVEKRIQEKFVGGGYGQFEKEYLDKVGFDLLEDDKEKLTIGWEAELLGDVVEPDDKPDPFESSAESKGSEKAEERDAPVDSGVFEDSDAFKNDEASDGEMTSEGDE